MKGSVEAPDPTLRSLQHIGNMPRELRKRIYPYTVRVLNFQRQGDRRTWRRPSFVTETTWRNGM
jgi:hypothetical protein